MKGVAPKFYKYMEFLKCISILFLRDLHKNLSKKEYWNRIKKNFRLQNVYKYFHEIYIFTNKKERVRLVSLLDSFLKQEESGFSLDIMINSM